MSGSFRESAWGRRRPRDRAIGYAAVALLSLALLSGAVTAAAYRTVTAGAREPICGDRELPSPDYECVIRGGPDSGESITYEEMVASLRESRRDARRLWSVALPVTVASLVAGLGLLLVAGIRRRARPGVAG